jgi:hypothetical protein
MKKYRKINCLLQVKLVISSVVKSAKEQGITVNTPAFIDKIRDKRVACHKFYIDTQNTVAYTWTVKTQVFSTHSGVVYL